MNKTYIYLGLIIIFAALTRLIGLEQFSPPLNRDEAAIGYNAYSLLLTGKDEHGVSWPLSFQSIGDYKMPGFIYLSLLPIKLFGLTVFATRFWSVLGGVLAVLGIYLVSFEILKLLDFNKEKSKQIALISSVLITINPWHIHYSRLAFEANVNLTLFIYSVWFLLKGLKQNNYLLGTAILWTGMQFIYSSTFVFLPIIFVAIFLLVNKYRPFLDLNKFKILLAVLILGLGTFFAIKTVNQVSAAKTSITIFSDPYLIDRFNHLRGEMQMNNPILAKIVYNKISYFGPILINNYIKNFSPGFLFANAINHPWHGIYGQGFFYFIDGLGFIFGCVYLLKMLLKKKYQFPILLIFSWLLISPLASAITIDAPHATRSLYLLPIFLIITGIGIFKVGEYLASKFLGQTKIVYILFATLYLVSFIKASYQYVVIYPYHQDKALFGGVKQAVVYADNIKQDRLVYMPEVSSSAYLYHLFYNRVDPNLVQKTAHWKGMDTAGLTHIESVGQWRFVDSLPLLNQKIIWIDRASNQGPGGYNLLAQFSNPATGIIEWKVYEN